MVFAAVVRVCSSAASARLALRECTVEASVRAASTGPAALPMPWEYPLESAIGTMECSDILDRFSLSSFQAGAFAAPHLVARRRDGFDRRAYSIEKTRMELHQLEYFLTVADEGGFTRAARALDLAQPSLSQQIAKLERELATPLFHRLGRRVELTEAGRALVPRAREILAAVSDVASAVSAASDRIAGRLRIGTVPTIAQFMLPPIVRDFLVAYPDVELVIHEDDRRELVEQLEAGAIDLALLSRRIEDEHLTVEPLLREEFRLVLPREHRLAERQRIRVPDLERERFVLLDQGAGLPNLIQDFCRSHGFEPEIACRSTQLATVQAMVSAGLGVSFVPNMAAETDSHSTRINLRLTGAKPERTVSAARHTRRFQTPAAREFIERLRRSVG